MKIRDNLFKCALITLFSLYLTNIALVIIDLIKNGDKSDRVLLYKDPKVIIEDFPPMELQEGEEELLV